MKKNEQLLLAAKQVLAIAKTWNTPAKPGGQTALALDSLQQAVDNFTVKNNIPSNVCLTCNGEGHDGGGGACIDCDGRGI